MMYDIVYVLKNDIESEEIRYSLRSVDQNFPHRKVFFFGGKPKGLEPDVMVEFKQSGNNKWEKVRNSLIRVCKTEELTEDFFLFNDDFYVLQPASEDFINFSDGSLEWRAQDIYNRTGKNSGYIHQLRNTATILRARGYDAKSFVLHIPMLINRKTALEVLNTPNLTPMFRSLYGNIANIPCIYHKDVKISNLTDIPGEDWDYLSSSDKSFSEGEVGKWIKNRFNTPSRFEKIDDAVHELYTEEGDILY